MKRYIFCSILVLSVSACKTSNMEGSKTKSNPPHQAGYAPVNGLDLYYEIHGEGKPLVLVHGGGSTIQTTFGKILPALAQKRKVIAVELQAHGHTKDRDIPESFQQDADDIAALLRYLKIDKADVLGFSNGGQTTLQIGISYPDRVNKLVIISAFYKREGAIKGFFESMEKATIKDMPAIYKEAYLKINNDSAGLQRMFEKDRARMVQFKNWSDEDLSSIKAHCLIVMGDKDVATPEHAVEMAHKIPNSELLILPGNHGSFIGEIMFKEQNSQIPALTAAVIEEFLNK
jgi:pimeloyl-ACP methyl ester carboxylesterase